MTSFTRWFSIYLILRDSETIYIFTSTAESSGCPWESLFLWITVTDGFSVAVVICFRACKESPFPDNSPWSSVDEDVCGGLCLANETVPGQKNLNYNSHNKEIHKN